MNSTRRTPSRNLLPCLLAGLLALPGCRSEEAEQGSSAAESEKPSLLKAPSKKDTKFLEKLQKLPRTGAEMEAERWINLGITVERGWVVDRSADKLVIEDTDLSKEDLGQHYIDKLEKKGWKEASYERDIGIYTYEYERKKATLKLTGRDRKGGGSTVTIEILDEGKD